MALKTEKMRSIVDYKVKATARIVKYKQTVRDNHTSLTYTESV